MRYRGIVQRYHPPGIWSGVGGYGDLAPDDPGSLPLRVQASLAKQAMPYVSVRMPQSNVGLAGAVNHQDGFEFGVGVAVTFRVFVDDCGAGACDVSPA